MARNTTKESFWQRTAPLGVTRWRAISVRLRLGRQHLIPPMRQRSLDFLAPK
jgi:hypothetical protein